jgi:tRNA(adenine34) deaminase
MNDKEIMEIAIKEAEIALLSSNFPVGAVLVINNTIIDKSHNQNRELRTLYSHAENNLLIKHSALIKLAARNHEFIELYTTLEPCLYCFGGILQHNISRLIYSISDPNVGACSLLPFLSNWYLNKKIVIEKNVLVNKYLPILYEYNEKHQKYDWDILIALNST